MTLNYRKVLTGASVFVLTVAAFGVGVPNSAALAQTQPPALDAQSHMAPDHEKAGRWGMGMHTEGRIAFLKAELKITDAQSAQWNDFAEAMRANAKELADTFKSMHKDSDKPRTALDALEARQRFEEMRIKQGQRYLAAFTPLYDSLSPDQKKAADELMTPRREHHHHERG